MTRSAEPTDPGFRIMPGVLDPMEMLGMTEAVQTMTGGRAGTRHLMSHPAVVRLANDPRALAIAREFVGASAVPYRATLFGKSSARNWLIPWHQDTALPLRERRDAAGWGPWTIKLGVTYAHAPAAALSRIVALRVHLDDSRQDNGPLRVLPGTHTLGVLSDAEVERLARRIQPVDCVAAMGGIVAMRPLLLHASSKAESARPRRVLHVEYAESLDAGDGLRLAIA